VKPADGYCGLQDSSAITLSFDNYPGPDAEEWISHYKFGTYLINARAIDLAGVETELNTTLGHLKGAVAPAMISGDMASAEAVLTLE
jgi:hypothetical protein